MALTFKGIPSGGFGGYSLTDEMLYNVKFWLDWGLLHHGAFSEYRYSDTSYYSDEDARLHAVPDERYGDGRVWEGVGPEWVWESGVAVANPPFQVSGINVNGAFYPTGTTGPCAFHVDYQHGRIIFDRQQNLTDDVRADYCHRQVQVAFADHPDFRRLMQQSVEDFLTDAEPSGTPAREHQVWLPSIFIQVDRGTQRGLQLGGGQIKTREVRLFIFADNPTDRNLLADWLDFQSRSALVMADLNAAPFPFDAYGDLASGALTWPQMAQGHPGYKLRIQNGEMARLNSVNPRLFRARVSWTVEIDVGGI